VSSTNGRGRSRGTHPGSPRRRAVGMDEAPAGPPAEEGVVDACLLRAGPAGRGGRVVSAGNSGALMAGALWCWADCRGRAAAIVTTFPPRLTNVRCSTWGRTWTCGHRAGPILGARFRVCALAARKSATAGGLAVQRRRGAQRHGAHARGASVAHAGGDSGRPAGFDYLGYVEGRISFGVTLTWWSPTGSPGTSCSRAARAWSSG